MTAAEQIYRFPRRALIFVIELYRTWVSPMRLPSCRFEPTCSAYAVEALDRHGFLWGTVLAVWRLLKCGPWHKPGYDPVPEQGPVQWLRRTQTSHTGASAPTSDRGK
ncbi:membrane protein insertion efficiency factor YidD [Gordonia shandongensis]|uniref:membrane protein insertion efficiency factor YidD n=1 Tax=Gordonia shandongensis TaxID=376351 RepID=UPI00040FF51A|nr:membrane protein insertion efficiency factor YidD [Gordonia shandongensis]